VVQIENDETKLKTLKTNREKQQLRASLERRKADVGT